MSKRSSVLLILLIFIFAIFFIVARTDYANSLSKISDKKEPKELEIFRACYPDLEFIPEYYEEKDDYLVKIVAPIFYGEEETKEIFLWWADCRFLPESELVNKDKYWKLIYPYQKIKDPATMNEEELARIRNFSSTENRQTSGGTPMFFYDFLYAAKSRVVIEDHIVRVSFLGKETKIHERVQNALDKVEKKIYLAAKTDAEVQGFIENLRSADAYNWRIIEGTGGRKSFHSYGIAVDLLPKRLGGKEIFWSWTKDKKPTTWMLTPLSARWTPPQKVIDFFEEEGFIWGGNWIIFDNMHFEYHPEILKHADF